MSIVFGHKSGRAGARLSRMVGWLKIPKTAVTHSQPIDLSSFLRFHFATWQHSGEFRNPIRIETELVGLTPASVSSGQLVIVEPLGETLPYLFTQSPHSYVFISFIPHGRFGRKSF